MITKQMIDALPTANWTRADYDAHSALNQTACKLILISPGHLKAYQDAPKKETPALLKIKPTAVIIEYIAI